jgi:hypothetical protein
MSEAVMLVTFISKVSQLNINQDVSCPERLCGFSQSLKAPIRIILKITP